MSLSYRRRECLQAMDSLVDNCVRKIRHNETKRVRTLVLFCIETFKKLLTMPLLPLVRETILTDGEETK